MKEEPIDFLLTLLLKTSHSYGDKNTVYPLLQDNLDKLDLNLAVLLRHWAKNYFARESLYNAQTLAAAEAIGNFGTIIGQFPHGNIAYNLDIAIACYEVIEVIFTRDKFPQFWATSKLNLGNSYGYRIYGDPVENLEKALLAYQDALQFYSYEKFPVEWAETQTNWVIFYLKKIKLTKNIIEFDEDLNRIVKICNQILEIFNKNQLIEKWCIVKNTLASAYCDIPNDNRSKNWELAIDIYNEVLGVINQKSFPEQWANTQMNLGMAYNKRVQGDTQENLQLAVQACQNSLKFYTRENYPFAYAILQNNLGNAYREQGLIASAIANYRLALEVHTPEIYPAEAFRTARNIGNTAFKSGIWKEAIYGYSIAIQAVEISRNRLKSDYRRQEIIEEAIGVYQKMVQASINAGEIEKAFEYAERSRSKRLVDLMASNDLYQSGEIPPEVKELLQQYEELQQQIDQQRDRLKSNDNRSQTRAAFQAYNEAIASLETEKQQVWEQIRRLDPVLAGEIQVNPLSLSKIQNLIDNPNTAILSFYTTDNDTHIFVLRQNQITLHTCTQQGLKTLQQWIFDNWLLVYVNDNPTWGSQIDWFLGELSQRLQLAELISQHLEGIEELILVPHLLLHQIPFAALPIANNQYLGDKFLIRYTPSCQILEFCQQRDKIESGDLSYGTVEDATDDLPCASFEGEQLAKLYNIPHSQRLRGSNQATKAKYRQLAEQVKVLHCCHHAESCLDNPLESHLKLGDGNITLGQLMTPGWRLPNLSDVFLSCCETNLGIPSLTDDILTLSTGFLCAGARSVVSTLWAVNDLATAVFSVFYYQNRQHSKSRPEALRQAQLQLRQMKKEEFLQRTDIKKLYNHAKTEFEEAKNKRSQYQRGSVERLKWDSKFLNYGKLKNQLEAVENLIEQFPFSHPRYWSAFICQGLR
ncbi:MULTISPECIES: CHAT domain-containing protein [Calothrix]|uniref:CHAT domain-containing protein n=2 Tax=Calothrix TaxID=1186 RepID=A0ABR8A762_9CYAN|nr:MULTISPECIES: CHAT domain-containing tetratricopeptide repeat protein [Calothrix]MBD2195285.1 CHAT domain-containing protein [Calothrix parietina FACHB-288]MBD2223744.1 CHAT domain-containing protein [Calothrix anomala FACHB-343]